MDTRLRPSLDPDQQGLEGTNPVGQRLRPSPNPDRQALFMMRFKKAASQQKTRMKRETIKPSTFYLDDDVKKKLNVMVKNLKMTKSALIASLIENADENDLR